jgi:aromatic ring-opening dioxygenase catalytic subunit (LigB family)
VIMSSYHNMADFSGRVGGAGEASAAFDEYLTAACASEDAAARREWLLGWAGAPHARDCHPARAEEHLLPLLVVAGTRLANVPTHQT